MILSLNGKWVFSELGKNNFLPATVPGCNFTDLLQNKIIKDPFIETYEEDAKWVCLADWEYKKNFEIDEKELNAKKINLTFLMLDTVADIFVNDKKVGHAENCHIKHEFDIKDALVLGTNTLRVVFYSPVNFVSKIYKREGAPVNSNGQNGIVHIRKPQCHFGWDWGPVLPPSGIQKDVYIEFINGGKIDNLKVTQTHENGVVKICAKADVIEKDKDTECEISLTHPDGTTVLVCAEEAEFTVENPELWWTHELSCKREQPLYAVKAVLKNNNEIIDENTKKIGLRTIYLNREKDEYGTNFQFILNGVPLFIKGANYIPSDSFITRFTEDKLEKLIDSALFSNLNMLRVWGGGYYESDEFYDICDKKGILIWQDFCFACQAYPFFKEDFLSNVKSEIKYNVSRLSHHASLALWCGNNEIEQMSGAWMHMREYIKWTEKFFYHILEPEIRKYDSYTSFIPGSPCGIDSMKGINSDNVGDSHLWAVWHGLQDMNYYRKRDVRFCSEFGFESLPDLKTIETFAKKEDYALNSKVFTSHQKCGCGNDKMAYYIASRFRLPKNFTDFIYLSQVTQQECISDATEYWRRNRGRSNGAMYWQFNDCWPCCSWSSIDYFGNYKALQYTARRFNAPFSVSIDDSENSAKIFVINDLNENKKATVKYRIFDFVKGVITQEEKEITADKLTVTELFNVDISRYNKKKTGIEATLIIDGKILQSKTALFGKEKKLNLPKASLKKDIKIEDNKLKITVSTDCFARLVQISSSKSSLPFSDNYFDLLPGENKTVAMEIDSSLTVQEQINSISLFTVTDVIPTASPILDKITQLKVIANPETIANYMYHSRKSNDVKI